MKSLIVFSRDNICILYGKVTKLWKQECFLSGQIYCPAERTFYEREIHVFWDKPEQTKSLTIGSYVAIECSVKNLGILTILEGGYTNAPLFAVGKKIRFGGTFNYPATDTKKEVNVIIGTITDTKFTKTEDGEIIENIVVAYKWFGKTFEKNLAVFNPSESFEHEKQYIFVCGPQTLSKSYIAKRIYECV